MSEMQVVMKFELLPNEILILCFEYLNAIDILYSFDGLNDRLNRLIRNISLFFGFSKSFEIKIRSILHGNIIKYSY